MAQITTSATQDPVGAATSPHRRAVRYAVGYVTLAAILPYLTLKLAWISGSTVGWVDLDAARDSSLVALNLATAGMDAVAAVLVLAFTHRFGHRIPGWLVLFPMWVGTGFLVPIAVSQPLGMAYTFLAGTGTDTAAQAPLEPWVYTVVYTGFTIQGVGLLTAFVLYAASRWPNVLRAGAAASAGGASTSPTRSLQTLLATAGAALAFVVGVVHIFWALGGAAGLPARVAEARTFPSYFVDGLFGLLAVAAGIGVLMLVRRARGTSPRIPVALVWVGASSMFAWGLYLVVIALLGNPLDPTGGSETAAGILNLVSLARLLAGVLVGLVAAFALSERADQPVPDSKTRTSQR